MAKHFRANSPEKARRNLSLTLEQVVGVTAEGLCKLLEGVFTEEAFQAHCVAGWQCAPEHFADYYQFAMTFIQVGFYDISDPRCPKPSH